METMSMEPVFAASIGFARPLLHQISQMTAEDVHALHPMSV